MTESEILRYIRGNPGARLAELLAFTLLGVSARPGTDREIDRMLQGLKVRGQIVYRKAPEAKAMKLPRPGWYAIEAKVTA